MSESMVGLTLAEINGCIPADSADEGINAVLANQSSNFTNIQKAVCRVSLFFVFFILFLYFKYTLEYMETFEVIAYHHIEALKTEFARLKSVESSLANRQLITNKAIKGNLLFNINIVGSKLRLGGYSLQ